MTRVACSGVIKRILAGTPNKDGWSFRGGGQDVTSDVLKAVKEFVGVGCTQVVTEDGKPVFEIEVRAIGVPK